MINLNCFCLLQVHDILHYLPTSEPSLMQFIFASEETGYRHLYLYTVHLATSVSKTLTNEGKIVPYHLKIFIVVVDTYLF